MLNKRARLLFFIALILIVAVILFKDSLLLSPSEDEGSEVALETLKASLIEAINKVKSDDSLLAQNQEKLNELLSAKTGKDYETIVRRFIEDPSSFPDSVPEPIKLDIKNYDISITQRERLTENSIEAIDTIFELVNKNQPLGEREHLNLNFINDHNYGINFDSVFKLDIYKIDDQAYVIIDSPAPIESGQESDVQESGVLNSPLTGYQVYSPPNPYNQVNRDFVVIVPYNYNFPLPANAVSYLNAKFPYVGQYFRENSENIATYTFTVYPVSVPNYNPQNIQYEDIFNAADPIINYAQHDMALILVPTTGCCSGYASIMYNSQGNVAYFNTNEPLISAVPVVFFDPSNPDINRDTDYVIKHEMGHVLTAFNPNINWNYFGGFLPHARGFLSGSGTYPCPSNGPIIDCSPGGRGDELDTMGSGRGLFSHHRAVHDLGFRSPSSVQSISASGTYTLCPSNRGIVANCPQELLIQNPNGANLALEILQTPLSSTYSTYQNCQNFFDSIILRAVDIEQGGGLGNILYRGNGGDVIYPVSSATSTCIGPSGQPLIDFPLRQGQSINTPVGTITFQSFVNNQATISLNYNIPACATGAPLVYLTAVQGGGPFKIYQQSLLSANFWDLGALKIESSSTCMTPDVVTVTTQVTALGNTHSSSRTVTLRPSHLGYTFLELGLPSTLASVPLGIYPMTITVTLLSAPGQSTTVTGQLEIVNPLSWYTVVPTSYCLDLDTAPYTPQNFGTNFQSEYPNIGGVVAPNPLIPGWRAFTYLPDLCILDNMGYSASDVICSNNVPGAPPNYGVVALKSCRAEMNNQYGFCRDGVCF